MVVFWVADRAALKMKAARTSETSVSFYQTTCSNNPDDSHLHTRRSMNLTSHESCYRDVRLLKDQLPVS
jgi:hypothetical protein